MAQDPQVKSDNWLELIKWARAFVPDLSQNKVTKLESLRESYLAVLEADENDSATKKRLIQYGKDSGLSKEDASFLASRAMKAYKQRKKSISLYIL